MQPTTERGKSISKWRVWLGSPAAALVVVLGVPLVVALVTLYGCAPTTLEQDYGRSVQNNIAQQRLQPQAGQDLTATVGQSPKAAAYTMDRYDKSFKAEEKKEFKSLTQY
jgi:hypothetical protein